MRIPFNLHRSLGLLPLLALGALPLQAGEGPQDGMAPAAVAYGNNDSFNFPASSDSFKYTVGMFSSNFRSTDDKQVPGFSVGMVAGGGQRKLSSDLKYARTGESSVLETCIHFLYFPFEGEVSPYMGVGFGTSSRKIDGIKSGSFFRGYSARIACGVELFTYSDVRIYLGVDVSLPFGTQQGSWTGIVTDPTTGESTVETRTVQGKTQYVDLSVKIGF